MVIRLAGLAGLGLLAVGATSQAADDNYCRLYSREMVRAYIRHLSADALPNLTVDSLQLQLTRFWTLCLNKDEPPIIRDLPTDGEWTADIWSQVQRTLPHPVGSVPASGPPETPPAPVSRADPPPPAHHPAPLSKPVATVRVDALDQQQPQGLCSSHGMRTVYQGRSWKCLPR